MTVIAVDCLFMEDGVVRIRRIKQGDHWTPVEQGRQWQDEAGRHVLVMIGGRDVREAVLRPETLVWELRTAQGPGTTVV